MIARVRKMAGADMPRVLEILAEWNMVPVAASAEIPHPEVSRIVLENSFVAEADGRIVGCCSYFVLNDGVCETSSFAVERAWLGRGAGFALQRARLKEMKRKGALRVITETDRPETVRWYLNHFPYRVAGTMPKRHAFGDSAIDHWTVLMLELDHAHFD